MNELENTISEKDIKKAMRLMEKCKKKPAKMFMNPVMASKVIKELNDKGIETKANNGKDYVFGLEVVLNSEIVEDVAYIE